MQVKKFGPMDKALAMLLVGELDYTQSQVDLKFPASVVDLYVRLDRVTGSSDRIQGDFVYDIETFAPRRSVAESAALDIEALLLGYPHSVTVDGRRITFDRVTQNVSPHEVPWDDDAVYRLLSTYVITARR